MLAVGEVSSDIASYRKSTHEVQTSERGFDDRLLAQRRSLSLLLGDEGPLVAPRRLLGDGGLTSGMGRHGDVLKLVSAVLGERVGVASEANEMKLDLLALSRGPFVPVADESGIVDC